MFASLLFLVSSAFASNCIRHYTPDQVHSIRLDSGRWKVGVESDGHWAALSCRPELRSEFFDGANAYALDADGEGNAGKTAHFLFYPDVDVPRGVSFEAEAQGLFGADRLEIPLPRTGQIYLNRSRYEQFRTAIRGVDVEIDAEPANPAKVAALKTLDLYTGLFPSRAESMAKQGKVTVVLGRNSTEEFYPKWLWPNGRHNANHLFAVLFSQDGNGVLEHTFHEVGGLFRILDNEYAHGLTWMAAYDQMQKLATSAKAKLLRQCGDLSIAMRQIEEIADPSKSIEYYIENVDTAGGYPMYAWGSAVFWKKINTELEANGFASMYALLDSIHRDGWEGINERRDLDRLKAAYARLAPKPAPFFAERVDQLFRNATLSELLQATKEERRQMGCGSAGDLREFFVSRDLTQVFLAR